MQKFAYLIHLNIYSHLPDSVIKTKPKEYGKNSKNGRKNQLRALSHQYIRSYDRPQSRRVRTYDIIIGEVSCPSFLQPLTSGHTSDTIQLSHRCARLRVQIVCTCTRAANHRWLRIASLLLILIAIQRLPINNACHLFFLGRYYLTVGRSLRCTHHSPGYTPLYAPSPIILIPLSLACLAPRCILFASILFGFVLSTRWYSV